MTPLSEAEESTKKNNDSRTPPFTGTQQPRQPPAVVVFTHVLVIISVAGLVSCSHLSSCNLAGTQQTVQVSSLVQIDLAKVHQTIAGFGAASGWTSPTMDDSQADAFFTVDKGIGLSLLRMRIAPDGTSLELAAARQAIARGA